MKVLTIFGTRPEIIRLSAVVRRLDALVSQHTLVHTGQNYDPQLSDIFFQELQIRPPDVHLGVRSGSFAEQAAMILTRSAQVLADTRPDRVLILGDTNSGLASIVAARMGIPVYHMEAGNRCYDDRVPEEINRRLIDHTSAVLMPYTHRSKENLLREGIERRRIFVTGNPIHEVLAAHEDAIAGSGALARLGVEKNGFFLVTLHRAENVDDADRLALFFRAFDALVQKHGHDVIVSVHPRTADKMKQFSIRPSSARVRQIEPLGFFDFVSLERSAKAVLSDSGTVQEECCIFRIPNVTLRDVTERPETIECGSNILSGARPDDVLDAVAVALSSTPDWKAPEEYLERNVSTTVAKILLGHFE